MTAITAPAASAAEALEPCERAILSVLRLWPRGAAEAAVAHRAGLDTTTAAAALRRLLDAGFVVSSEETPLRCGAITSASCSGASPAPQPPPRSWRMCPDPTPPSVEAPKDRFPISSGTTSVRDQTPPNCACPATPHAGGLPPHRIVRLRGPILGAVTLHRRAARRLPRPLSRPQLRSPQADRSSHRGADLTAIAHYSDVLNNNMIAA